MWLNKSQREGRETKIPQFSSQHLISVVEHQLPSHLHLKRVLALT